MKWTKVRAGLYRSGKYELRQAKWRASNDGWLITTDDGSFHDSSRLLASAKKRCETHAADEAKKAVSPEKITAVLTAAGIPTPEGTLLDASYRARTTDWYVQTDHGWVWWDDRTREWRPHATGP